MNHSHNNSISHIRFHLKISLRYAQGLNKTHTDLYMKRWHIWAKSLLNSCIESISSMELEAIGHTTCMGDIKEKRNENHTNH